MYDPALKKTVRWTLYTTGGIVALAGLFVAVSPMLALMSLSSLMGIGLLVSGVNHLVPYFSMRNSEFRPKWLLVSGVLDVIFGAVFISRLGLAILAFSTLAGLWAIFAACARAYMSYVNRAAGLEKWRASAASCALMALIALFLLAFPTMAVTFAGAATSAAGVLIIAEGRIIYG
ncbi:MAG: DUF308 domain-containing protein [Synergistaceae bacterium]|jgi:uncharacterized membrane protein HdeD (DUF308 family)|nr:DUF308 domain-containing protein [Synergistaceae bacterium]